MRSYFTWIACSNGYNHRNVVFFFFLNSIESGAFIFFLLKVPLWHTHWCPLYRPGHFHINPPPLSLPCRFCHSIHSVHVFLRSHGDGPCGLNPPCVKRTASPAQCVLDTYSQVKEPSHVTRGVLSSKGRVCVWGALQGTWADGLPIVFLKYIYPSVFWNSNGLFLC